MESICGDKAPPMAGGIAPYIAGVFAMFAIENIVEGLVESLISGIRRTPYLVLQRFVNVIFCV
jgi:hypothetical protein